MIENLISVKNLHIAFGDKVILKSIDLDVRKGETLAIIGPSGSGKSTILKVLIGLLKPTSGQVFIKGEEVTDFTEKQWNNLRKNMGMVFQYSALFDFLDVGENIAFGLRKNKNLTEEEINSKVDSLLDLIGLEDAKNLYPVELSGGMKKRVGLARAIAVDPEIVLYDEPTAGLDPIRTMNISKLMKTTQEKFGVTSLLVTHDMASTFYVADRIAMLHEGEILYIGTPEEFKTSDNPIIREFIYGEFDRGGGL